MSDWKQELNDLLALSWQRQQSNTAWAQQHHTALIVFFSQIVVPAFELLRAEFLQRQRDASVSWSGTTSLSTELSASITCYTGAPPPQLASLREPITPAPDDHILRHGLGVGLDALLPAGREEFTYTLGVRQHQHDPVLVAESHYIEQSTGQRNTREQPFPHQFGTADQKQITTTEIIEQVLRAYRVHLERATG